MRVNVSRLPVLPRNESKSIMFLQNLDVVIVNFGQQLPVSRYQKHGFLICADFIVNSAA
jgi:hypothetical protein